jgi:hypothetical protein
MDLVPRLLGASLLISPKCREKIPGCLYSNSFIHTVHALSSSTGQKKMVDRGKFNKNGVFPFSANGAGFLLLTSSISKRFLPPNFQPGSWDVICHNGKEPQEHGKSFETSGLPLFSTLITSNCIPLTVYYSWEQPFQDLY